MKISHILFGSIAISFLAGCSDEKTNYLSDSESIDSVTLVASIGGNGDNGYNDLVLAGVIRFYNRHDNLKMSLLHPKNIEEAKVIYRDWDNATSGKSGKSIIIFSSDDYEDLTLDKSIQLDSNQRALFFESEETDLPKNITTFTIRRYGISYLAGAMASKSKEAHVVAAYEKEGVTKDAIKGFCDGYLDAGGNNVVVDYLALDETGYSMPNEAYTLAGTHDEAFIYPLAGGSNNGIYKYSRDMLFSLQLVAGMDVDCSEYSTRVPFSVVIHIDNVIYNLLEQWETAESLASHIEFGFQDNDAVKIVTNKRFLERVILFEDYYGKEDYWDLMLEKYRDIALQKEIQYYEK